MNDVSSTICRATMIQMEKIQQIPDDYRMNSVSFPLDIIMVVSAIFKKLKSESRKGRDHLENLRAWVE
jgi:hypothetical protein